jgi:hypothetical protein
MVDKNRAVLNKRWGRYRQVDKRARINDFFVSSTPSASGWREQTGVQGVKSLDIYVRGWPIKDKKPNKNKSVKKKTKA